MMMIMMMMAIMMMTTTMMMVTKMKEHSRLNMMPSFFSLFLRLGLERAGLELAAVLMKSANEGPLLTVDSRGGLN